ncbi:MULTISPECIES: hypothetical protein [unclassified Amycolatopsis]|uniref:hypothetical protein n=1 Tax=unclassified Amycolatopsis TaxID=2618356 RepID=UPI001F22B6C4|nr:MULTISPECIES: hypothetical protein [unclassified Amycolatopsis]
MELERSRGITIRSAVAAFRIGELHVNLIDIFANKLDRAGARYEGLLTDLAERLGVACVPAGDFRKITPFVLEEALPMR